LFLDAIEEATLQKQIVDPKPLKESSSQAAGTGCPMSRFETWDSHS